MSKSAGDVSAVADHLLGWKAVRVDDYAQRRSGNVLHGYECDTVFLVDFVNRANVRMVQLRCGARFVKKSTTSGQVIPKTERQNLYGNFSVKAFVVGAINFAHTASADLF